MHSLDWLSQLWQRSKLYDDSIVKTFEIDVTFLVSIRDGKDSDFAEHIQKTARLVDKSGGSNTPRGA